MNKSWLCWICLRYILLCFYNLLLYRSNVNYFYEHDFKNRYVLRVNRFIFYITREILKMCILNNFFLESSFQVNFILYIGSINYINARVKNVYNNIIMYRRLYRYYDVVIILLLVRNFFFHKLLVSFFLDSQRYSQPYRYRYRR